PIQVDYVTRGKVHTTVTDRSIEASVARDSWRITYGVCIYTETLAAYERLDPRTQARRSVHVLPQRQRQFATQGVWLSGLEASGTAPDTARTAWHTLVHAVLAGLPLLLLSDTNTMRGGVYEDANSIEAVFSDAHAGGNGTCAFLYQAHARVLRVALQLLWYCDCTHGCNRCVARHRCDTCERDGSLQRQAGMQLLQRLVGEAVPTFASVAASSAASQAQ